MNLPELVDYFVHIPPGSSSDAFCETIITGKTPLLNLQLEV